MIGCCVDKLVLYIYLPNQTVLKKSLIGLLILTLIHLSPAISQIEADPDLIVYYKFDGTAEDASANGFDAIRQYQAEIYP